MSKAKITLKDLDDPIWGELHEDDSPSVEDYLLIQNNEVKIYDRESYYGPYISLEGFEGNLNNDLIEHIEELDEDEEDVESTVQVDGITMSKTQALNYLNNIK